MLFNMCTNQCSTFWSKLRVENVFFLFLKWRCFIYFFFSNTVQVKKTKLFIFLHDQLPFLSGRNSGKFLQEILHFLQGNFEILPIKLNDFQEIPVFLPEISLRN